MAEITAANDPEAWKDKNVTAPAPGGFDPDAYLAAKKQAAIAPPDKFDPDAYLEARTPSGLDQDAYMRAWKKNQPLDWSDVAGQAVKNAPGSARNFAHDIVQPVVHPIDTLTNLGNVAAGVIDKMHAAHPESGPSPTGGGHEHYADAVGQFFKDRYGSVEGFKHAVADDPVGVAGDLSILFTGGESALARLAPGLEKAAASVARTIDPVNAAAKPVAWAAGKANEGIKAGLGVTTGVGQMPLEQAYQAGLEGGDKAKAFRDSITGKADMTDVLDDARGALEQMRRDRGETYRNQMEAMRREDDALGIENQILDFGKIDDAVSKAQEVQTFRGRSGKGIPQKLDPGADAVRSEMLDQIDHWRDLDPVEYHTAEGIDALKRSLGSMLADTAYGSPARKAASDIYNAVKQTIVDQAPVYANIMKGYEDASKQLTEIEKTLSLNPKANIDTALRKLQSVMRDNVNTNYGRRGQLANQLVNAGAPNMLAKLAGQSLNPIAPRGLSRLVTGEILPLAATAFGAGAHGAAGAVTGGLSALATLPLYSPRIVGNAAYAAGAARRLAKSIPGAPGQTIADLLRPARTIGRFNSATDPYAP